MSLPINAIRSWQIRSQVGGQMNTLILDERVEIFHQSLEHYRTKTHCSSEYIAVLADAECLQCRSRKFTSSAPNHHTHGPTISVNKSVVLHSLEQNARINASRILLEQFNKKQDSGYLSSEEAKQLLKAAHARISDIIIFFIIWCRDDEKYMTTFDEAEAAEGSELYRARAAVSTTLKCIAHDISKIPKSDPSRAENQILDMQIDDIVEVADKYLRDTDGRPPANWTPFWEEIYILMHALGSELEKGGYGEDAGP